MNDSLPPSPAVELRSVSKRFGPRVILDSIDLAIARAEVLVLVGPSGSGKSTLLKIVSGIETPDAGQVLLAGRDCTHVPPYRRAVHTVFQNYALFPHLDVTGNVAFPLAVAGMSRTEQRRKVDEALEWVKLTPHRRRRVETLSGGERQRVALARALVDQPACVLLDEPLSALDPNLRAETLELLQDLQQRLQTTFLFITHDREEALRLGHRIGVLNQGRLEQIGTPEEVYRHPQTAFVASFLGRINWITGSVITSGGQTRIEVAGETAPIAALTDLPVAGQGRVKLGIRPEDLQIQEQGGLGARVIHRQFLGDSTIIRLQLADGTSLVVDQRPPHALAAIGDEVRIGWSSVAGHVYPADVQESAT